jgi:methyl-accepting chemotaxis protein
MRPVPATFLLTLIVALCVLCAWQWNREVQLRKIVVDQRGELESLRASRDEIETRVRTADAEILRLTGSLNELRGNSVPKLEHEEVLEQSKRMSDAITKQNALITEQNESIAKANAGIQQANETIKKVTTERDGLAKQLNEVTERYNALAKKGGG